MAFAQSTTDIPFAEKIQRRPLVMAHRGGAGLWPENTMYGFERAVDLGVDVLETEIHSTADNILVLMHDSTVDRTTNGSGPISSFTLEELKTLDAGYNWTSDGGQTFPFRGSGITVPTLEEVFTAVPSDTVLFSSPEMLETWLLLDLERLLADVGDDRAEHLGRWSYMGEDGSTHEMPVYVRTRGNSRRQPEVCSFPPLRFRFREHEVGNTLFAGQDKLKLVTHCRTEVREYQQYLLEEYLLYHVYQMVSDMSFQVRLARVTYSDRRQNVPRIMRAGFFLEDKDAMAARLGGTIVKRGERAGELDAATTATLEVFQYLIGNVEWNLDDHDNIEVVDIGGEYYPVPVDFDVAGVIAPPYAKPNEALGVQRVGDRVFRGACRPRDDLDAALGLFADRKDDIYALYRSFPLLEDERRERTLAYFDEFFDIIGDSQRVEREFTARCP